MRFQCPSCRGIVAVDNTDAGTDVECGHCGQIVTVPSARTSPGAVVADFLIIKELGKGGMGTVYLSHQLSLDRPAALKILSETYAANAAFVAAFIKEARAAAKLNHPNIVQAYAVGEDEGVFYFAMEHLAGETMKQVLKHDGIIPCDKALVIVQEIAEALSYAWNEQKLIHRDIKPDNIMLTSGGRAKLADLGLARVAGENDDANSSEVMGTPQYISPEQLTGAPLDVRSDIYSLGATFYHFITGRFPFEGTSAAEIAKKHLEEPLIPPSALNPAIPEEVSRIVVKMMAKNPIMRYQTTENLIDDLRNARHGGATVPGISSLATPASSSGSVGGRKLKISTSSVQHAQLRPTISQTAVMENSPEDRIARIRETNRKKARQRNILLAVLGVMLLLAVAGGITAAVLLKDKSKTSSGGNSAGVTYSDPLIAKAAELLKTGSGDNADTALFHAKAEEYYLLNDIALQKLAGDPVIAKLNISYFESDEILSNNARNTALKTFKEDLDSRRNAFEKAEKERLEQEARAKAQAEQEALAQQRASEQKRLFDERVAARKLSASREKARCAAVLISSHNDDRILKQFDTFADFLVKCADDEHAEIQDISTEHRAWLDGLRNDFEAVRTIRETLFNGGDLLAGKQIEYANEIYSIKQIKSGNIEGMLLGSSKSRTFAFSDLPLRQKLILLNAAAIACNKADYVYFYRFLDGEYKYVMHRLVKDDDDKRNALSYILTSYLNTQLSASDAKKAELKEKFGTLDEYKGIFGE